MKAPSLISLWPGERFRTAIEQKKEAKTQPPSFTRKHYVLLLSVGLCLWQPIVGIAQESQKPAKSLYERLGEISEERLGGQKLGGAYKIAAIVSDLIDRLQVNEVINDLQNWVDRA